MTQNNNQKKMEMNRKRKVKMVKSRGNRKVMKKDYKKAKRSSSFQFLMTKMNLE